MPTQTRLFKYLLQLVEKMNTTQKRAVWYLADAVIFSLATVLTAYIFINLIQMPRTYYIIYIALTFVIYFFATNLTKLSSRIKRYSNFTDVIWLFLLTLGSSLVSSLISALIHGTHSIRFAGVVSVTAALGVASLRLIWQSIYIGRYRLERNQKNGKKENVVLIGAGDGGSIFMENYTRHATTYRVVAIVDDDPGKLGLNLNGVQVAGGLDKLPDLVKNNNITRAIIAIPSLTPNEYENILRQCNALHVRVYNMPRVEDVLLGIHQSNATMRKVDIADLLGRTEVNLDESMLRSELEGKTILITGAGGSIGSEISRQVSRYNPERVLLLGHGENSIYHIYQEHLQNTDAMTQYVPVIADVQDYDRILQIFEDEKPDVVYHAAAHKHVPLMEVNPAEAFKNNIIGTHNVVKAVNQAKVPKMVMISTDKAVRPPNVMGATKRIAELIVTGMNKISDSTYCAVRFGNVLGSRGSVVPAFEKMIKEGGPVKVTDFRMTRYFMTIPEASRLVVYAGAHSEGGEVFILNMGEPVKILDLARKMILLSGNTVEEIGIVESGIRQGEKLYEELLTSSELVDDQIDENIFIGKVSEMTKEEITGFINEMNELQDDKRALKDRIIEFANETTQD